MASVITKDAVAQKDRISIDISDMRDEIDTCRTDAAWQELPMSAKIRVLVKERLDLLKREQKQKPTAK